MDKKLESLGFSKNSQWTVSGKRELSSDEADALDLEVQD
jgi:hypothetical protein